MDDIQRTLIRAGRKDLAQEYYQKTAAETISKDQIKRMISMKLQGISDQSFATVLRKILFSYAKPDWNKVLQEIQRSMPETKKPNYWDKYK